jgi:hypothetical protein
MRCSHSDLEAACITIDAGHALQCPAHSWQSLAAALDRPRLGCSAAPALDHHHLPMEAANPRKHLLSVGDDRRRAR